MPGLRVRRKREAAGRPPSAPAPSPPIGEALRLDGAWPLGWRADALLALALVCLTLLVYAPVSTFEFVSYDDGWFVTENRAVAGGVTTEGVRWAFENAYLGTGGPLTWVSHMADVELYGVAPSGHHVTSLALHLANTLLLFGLLAGMTGRRGASAMVAALFAIHPHVESVAWVSQRKDVLSTFFWLLAIGAYVRYARHPTAGRYAAVVVLHGLGLLSKPMVATLPFTLLLLDVWPLGRHAVDRVERRRAVWLLLEKVPLALLSAVTLWATLRAQQALGAVADARAVPFITRMANALVSYASYVVKLFWPSGLAPHYPYRLDLGAALVAGCLVCLVAVTVDAWRLRSRLPAVSWWSRCLLFPHAHR